MSYLYARLGKKEGNGENAKIDILKMDGRFIGTLIFTDDAWQVEHCCIVPEFREDFTTEALAQAKERFPEG